jgi:uncharacterized membrane protein
MDSDRLIDVSAKTPEQLQSLRQLTLIEIRTFWWGLLWSLLGALTLIVGVGFVILLAAAVWTIYRWVNGLLYWNDRKPMPV